MFSNRFVSLLSIVFSVALIYSIKLDYDVVNIIERGNVKTFAISDRDRNKCDAVRRFKTHLDLVDNLGIKYRVQIDKKECLRFDRITAYCKGNKCYTSTCLTSDWLIGMKFVGVVVCIIISIYYFFK
jgi:hypothetical protein